MGSHVSKPWIAAAPMLFAVLIQSSPAQSPSADTFEELQGLAFEDLANIEVTTVSRQSEKLLDAASAIEVISDQTIRRFGAVTIPDALELATGLEVARDDVRTWAISARGFNTTTANKMQVMMDGRLLYTPLYSGIFWDAQNTLMEDVDRIEVVRGPGATLWGANAVNGVISIITKEAAETQGWLMSAGAGDHHEAFASARYGGSISDSTHFRVYGKYESDDELPTLSGEPGQDERSLRQMGFRVDSYLASDDHITVQGDLYDGDHGIPGSADGTLSGGNVLARWTRILHSQSEFELQVYYDATQRRIPDLFAEDRDSVVLDFQHLLEGESDNKLVWGANYHYSKSHLANSARAAFIPSERDTHSYSAFAQYQAYLVPDRLGAIAGLKVESNTLGGTEALPSARLFWHLNPNALLWSSVSRATRKPTQLDTDIRILDSDGSLTVRGSPEFDSEVVTAYELGYRAQLLNNLSVDLALFHNDYTDLRSLEPDPVTVFPLIIDNLLEAKSDGAELTVAYQPTSNWSISAGAVWLDLDFQLRPESTASFGGSTEGNDPDHWFHIRTAIDLSPRWEISANLRYVGALPDPVVPSHTDLDLRVAWQATDVMEISVTGQNLLDPAHPEFGSQTPDATQVPRQFFASATWRF